MVVKSDRVFLRGRGVNFFDVPLQGCKHNSRVAAGISELAVVGGGTVIPHMGNAHMAVLNVVPREGVVTVRVNVAWDNDLDFEITVIADNPPFS
jgi:hypothetical protein